MNLHNIIASYAPIAGAKFDTLSDLGACWWSYNTSVKPGTSISASFTAENKYLLSAHNNEDGDTVAGIPAGITKRLRRSWLMDKFGIVSESMSLTFHTTGLGAGVLDTNREYFLLYAEDGNTYETVSSTGVLLTNNTLVFPGAAIREGWYTIGWKPVAYLNTPGNHALAFNGAADIVRVPFAAFGKPAGDFSIELWAKAGAGGSGDDALINANENVSGRKGYYIEYGYANSATPGLKAGIARSNGNWLTAQYATAGWQPDEWHHVVMTYNATAKTIRLFQDGVQVASANMGSDTALFSTRPFGIGGSDAYTGNGFKGALDEVRVWNKELSAAEIKDSMHLQVSAANPLLKAYYKLDSLSNGTTVINETGAALNGTASGSMNSGSVVLSYAPVELQPLNGFVSYNANWSAKNKSYNRGLNINATYTDEAAYLIHKTNNQAGLDSIGTITDLQLKRVWHIGKKGIGHTTLGLQFFADSLIQAQDSINTVYLLKSDDNINFSLADSILAGNISDTLTFYMQDTLDCYLTLGFKRGPGLPLPVELIDFGAHADRDRRAAILTWLVAEERNLDQYVLERSRDARTFSILGSLKAAAKSSYTFTDEAPANGLNYYRLKMSDRDGGYTYGPVRSLFFAARPTIFSVLPNPVKNELLVRAAVAPGAALQGTVTDISGSVILRFVTSGATTIINTAAWGKGTYLVKLSDGEVFKIVKL